MAIGDKKLVIKYGTSGGAYIFPDENLKFSVGIEPHYYNNDKCEKQKARIGDMVTVDISADIITDTPTSMGSYITSLSTAITYEWGSTGFDGTSASLAIYLESAAVHNWVSLSGASSAGFVDGGFHNKSLEFPDEAPKSGTMQPFRAQYQFIVLNTSNNVLLSEVNTTTQEDNR